MGLGLYSDFKSAISDSVVVSERFYPDENKHSYYLDRYQRFRSLYENNKEEFDLSVKTATFGGGK
jgi:sugar (pentulose or hexulose) kinase